MLKPRFLIANSEVLLVMVEYHRGEIVGIHGPVQAKGEKGVLDPQALVRGMHEYMMEALHVEKPIKFEDLPEKVRLSLHSSSV